MTHFYFNKNIVSDFTHQHYLLQNLKDNKKYKDDKLKLGIITIDLSDIKAPNGEQFYKFFFEKFKEMSDNELCDIQSRTYK